MPRITDELIPLAIVRQPTIMDGPHTWRQAAEGSTIYRCAHCGDSRTITGSN